MRAVMLSFLPPVLRGVIAALLLPLNTLFWCTPLFALALLKLVLPFRGVRLALDPAIHGIATRWIAGNSAWMRLTQPSRPGTPLFLMNTTWPAVIKVCGPMNQPVPIHCELSAAVISKDACTRQG